MEDQQIITEYLKGNEAAFSLLVGKYTQPIFSFIFQLVGNQAVAEDLTQECFVKVWKNLSRYNQTASVKTWIYIIARNTAYDYLKKKKEVTFSQFIDDEGNNPLEAIDDENPLPDELMEKKDLAEQIEKKLQQLPANYRVLLLMHYREDFSLSEIALIFGKSYNTIKSQHHRALVSLRKILTAEEVL